MSSFLQKFCLAKIYFSRIPMFCFILAYIWRKDFSCQLYHPSSTVVVYGQSLSPSKPLFSSPDQTAVLLFCNTLEVL